MKELSSHQQRKVSSRLRTFASSALAWDIVLAALTLAWAVIFTRLFFPGRVNVDIGNQYLQATGKIPLSDWHPPIMSIVWRFLIDLTGEAGSLLVLQVGMIAVSCWLVGVLVHRCGAPRWVSLLGPAVMTTPWVLSQLTTLWKDTQMAVALLLAVMLLSIVRLVPKAWVLWIPAFVLLVYALGLRKNAIFALVPIAVYLGYCGLAMWNRRRRAQSAGTDTAARPAHRRTVLMTAVMAIVVLALLGGGMKATDALIGSKAEVQATGQISQIFLDDIMFSVPNGELMASDAPTELKEHISSARDKCLARGEIWDAYWNCYGRGVSGKAFSPVAYQDELKDLWLKKVITHPARYLEYRAAVFSTYFFSSKLEYWEAGWDGDAQKVGIEGGSAKADFIVRPYVEDFALATFPMLFKPWFWSLLAVVLLGLAWRSRRRAQNTGESIIMPAGTWSTKGARASLAGTAPVRTFWPEVTMLATSALCYIFGYFPIVPANHFRYTYWPALAVTVAVVFVLAMWRSREPGSAATPRSRASSESKT